MTINLPVLTDFYLCSLVFFDFNINQEYIAKALAGGIRSTAPMRFSDGENRNVLLKCDLVTKILTVHTCTCTLTHIPRDEKKREKKNLRGL